MAKLYRKACYSLLKLPPGSSNIRAPFSRPQRLAQ